MAILLTRDAFREGVFARDNHTCVLCEKPAVDAHHIIERRLFNDGGYYINNGASLCADHHMDCEMTIISVEDVREACGIEKAILPEHMYEDQSYDKWGNIVLPNGQRLKGELFFDESVQKVLKKARLLDIFTGYVKYPRTYHLPWSLGLHDDDRMMPNFEALIGKNVVVTEKMDGENTSFYTDHNHARSVDSGGHESRDWVKNFWAQIAHDIPTDWRICGENMFAEHSIPYNELLSYFYGFSIWNEKNQCLPWDETLEWFELMGIHSVPIVYQGVFDVKAIQYAAKYITDDPDTYEGYVVRVVDSFDMSEFRKVVGKYVRKGHVNTVKHWMRGKRIIPNKLK